MFLLGYLWWIPPPALWPGICCENLQNRENAHCYLKRCSVLTDSHSLPHILCGTVLSKGHFDWKSRHVGQFQFLLCCHSWWPSKWINVPVTMSSLCPYDLSTAGSALCSVMRQDLLFFNFLCNPINDCKLVPEWPVLLQFFSVPQLCLMASHQVHILTVGPSTHCLGLLHLFLQLWCSLVYLGFTTAFVVMHIPGISSFLFAVWLCLDRQSAMKSCGPDLYSILMLYWCMYNTSLCNLSDKLAMSSS